MNLISYNNKRYLVIEARPIEPDMDNNSIKEELNADISLKKGNKIFFCSAIQEAEILEEWDLVNKQWTKKDK